MPHLNAHGTITIQTDHFFIKKRQPTSVVPRRRIRTATARAPKPRPELLSIWKEFGYFKRVSSKSQSGSWRARSENSFDWSVRSSQSRFAKFSLWIQGNSTWLRTSSGTRLTAIANGRPPQPRRHRPAMSRSSAAHSTSSCTVTFQSDEHLFIFEGHSAFARAAMHRP
jgi:hypothetical protein